MSLSIRKEGTGFSVSSGSSLLLTHSSDFPLLSAGSGVAEITSHHGNYRIRDRVGEPIRTLERFEILQDSGDTVSIRFSPGGAAPATEGTILLTLSTSHDSAPGSVTGSVTADVPFNRLAIHLDIKKGSGIYGGGEQFSRFNLRGSLLPLWTQEQGVGRAHNLVTLAANLHSGAGGHWHSTYFPQPSFVTDSGTWFHSDSSSYAEFDFRGNRRKRSRIALFFWTGSVEFTIGDAGTLSGAVERLSTHLGRQPRLPDWVDQGLILGLQGGSDIVRAKLATARDAGILTAGVWAQDWEGRRKTAFGSQLFWNWKFDPALYPDLPNLINELHDRNQRFLGYINPFLATEGDLYREAADRGFLVRSPSGEPYQIVVTTFPAGLVDLTNPDAFSWIKSIIRTNMIDIGLDGWMADFGEYLPADAVLADGTPAKTFHNRYPAEWARANFEAVAEAGVSDRIMYFMRAGYTGSSRYASATWAGDQLVDWSRHDGLPSVLPAALSLGMCGVGIHHSDIGGYTTLFGKKRSRELFARWAEQAAFTVIMRNHEGNRPGDNWQWDGDTQTMRHLARMTGVFAALRPYRREVLSAYTGTGAPPIRPLNFHYQDRQPGPGAPVREYLFGDELLVAPVLNKGRSTRTLTLPSDEWVHLWSGVEYGPGRQTVRAPLGYPPVFYRKAGVHNAFFAEIGGRFP